MFIIRSLCNKLTLKEGDWMDMNGKVHSKKMESGNWTNKPDNVKNK